MSEQPEPVATSDPGTLNVLAETDEMRQLRHAATPSPQVDAGMAGPASARTDPALDQPPPRPRLFPGTDKPVVESGRGRGRLAPSEQAALAGEHPLVRELLLTPGHWHLWPAVAVLRWMLRQASGDRGRLLYRSKPSLDFPPGEVEDVELTGGGSVGLTLRAPGIAAPGTPLPTSDIQRIIDDQRRGGAIAAWLDGFGDRFMQVVEVAQAQEQLGVRSRRWRRSPHPAHGQQPGRSIRDVGFG